MKHLYLALVLSLTVSSASAHEFIVKPARLSAAPGADLAVSVLSAHRFMVSEEIEPLDRVDLSLVSVDAVTPLRLRENTDDQTLEGTVRLTGNGTAILAGHRKGMIWTQTTTGWRQAGKQDCKGVIHSGKYEKFCKALVTVGKDASGYDRIIGHTLEIVPLSDPAGAAVGREIDIKVLLNGKPLSTNVYATFDGFSTRENTYAYFTESRADGTAAIRLTHSGAWMVRVQHKTDSPTPDYDTHVMRAVLVFGVN